LPEVESEFLGRSQDKMAGLKGGVKSNGHLYNFKDINIEKQR
jgi:hypothetical protein